MNNLKMFVPLAALAFLFITPSVAHAGTVVTINNVFNANGSIGIYLQNELGPIIQIDNTQYSTNVLTFSVNGSNTSINAGKSDSELPKGIQKLVVLNSAWPSGGYITIDITYRDASGGFYPKESAVAFATPPLSLANSSTNPARVYSRSTKVTFNAKLTASGESAVSDINFQLVSNPRYFVLSDSKYPGALSKGLASDIILTFDRDQQDFPDTVIYTTVYVPLKFTYQAMGQSSSQVFNSSFIIFNSVSSGGLLPRMNATIAVPEKAEPGKNIPIPVYAYNSNVGGNSACNVSINLAAESPDIKIPVQTIIPEGEFKGRVDAPDQPTATFNLNLSGSIKSGSYKLTLTVNYIDCAWKFSDTLIKAAALNVLSAGESAPVAQPLNNSSAALPSQQKPVEHIINATTSPQAGGKGIPSIYVTLLAVIGVVLLFGVIYFLELRSRTIY